MKAIGLLGFLMLASTGAAQEAPKDPAGFLRWSMDRMASHKSFQATCHWDSTYADSNAVRTIFYEGPNRFRLVTNWRANGFEQFSISDGKSQIEYSSDLRIPGSLNAAPATIFSATSVDLTVPSSSGSLLYQFLGGSKNYASLVDEKSGVVTFGRSEKVGKETARLVRFMAPRYERAEALIGLESGLVYRIKCDRLVRGGPTHDVTTERYTNIATDQAIDAKLFDTTPPKGFHADGRYHGLPR